MRLRSTFTLASDPGKRAKKAGYKEAKKCAPLMSGRICNGTFLSLADGTICPTIAEGDPSCPDFVD